MIGVDEVKKVALCLGRPGGTMLWEVSVQSAASLTALLAPQRDRARLTTKVRGFQPAFLFGGAGGGGERERRDRKTHRERGGERERRTQMET